MAKIQASTYNPIENLSQVWTLSNIGQNTTPLDPS